jgi:hypothetical protein
MRVFLLAGVMGILAVVAAPPAGAQTPAAVGNVTEVLGPATVTQLGPARPLQTGDAIFSEDILETGPSGKLLIGFSDGTRLTLGPNAEVVIDEFIYNPSGGTNNAALRVAAGAARLVAGAIEKVGGTQAIKVSTPVATIGIRGTDFFIEMLPDRLSVALFSGFEIAVSNANGETVLRPGQGTDIYGTGAPTQALTWGTERINRALSLVTLAQIAERPLPYAQPIAAEETFANALTGGTFKFDARYRYEFVDQASRPRHGHASTLRLRAGYETLSWHGFFAGIEGEVTREIGNDGRSDGVVANPQRPLIPDPESEMLNQAYVGWMMPGDDDLARTKAVIGRQRINYENERWIGGSAFRQNDQTFDAATAEARIIPGVNLRYAYVGRVNRILGNNLNGHWHGDNHLFAATTNLIPFGVTTAYAYLLDLHPVPALSSATYGVRYDGLVQSRDNLSFGLEAEAARQTDYAANPRNYALTYALLRPWIKWGDTTGTTLAVGWERLGGNGIVALQTPLATLHRHNGWADVFTTTPVNGLDDLHVRLLQEFADVGFMKKPKLDLRFHEFSAARGGAAYGREFDVDINASVLGRVTTGMRFARYDSRGLDADTTKLWFYVELQY